MTLVPWTVMKIKYYTNIYYISIVKSISPTLSMPVDITLFLYVLFVLCMSCKMLLNLKPSNVHVLLNYSQPYVLSCGLHAHNWNCLFPLQHVCETDEREEVVICELCEASVLSFNQHMKRYHPGCGHSANRQGYRSNGSYVDGWFGGECGSGNPYYLLCGSCREKYLGLKSKRKTTASEKWVSKLPDFPYILCTILSLKGIFDHLLHLIQIGRSHVTITKSR